MRGIVLTGVIATLGALIAVGVVLSRGADDGDRPVVSFSGPVRHAEARPDVTGTTLTGETISFSEFRGKPILVNVWASW